MHNRWGLFDPAYEEFSRFVSKAGSEDLIRLPPVPGLLQVPSKDLDQIMRGSNQKDEFQSIPWGNQRKLVNPYGEECCQARGEEIEL